jgi:hypothetical protein
MTRVSDEPASWRPDQDPDALMGDLRRQIDAAKARMSEHREQLRAAGLAARRDDTSEGDASR